MKATGLALVVGMLCMFGAAPAGAMPVFEVIGVSPLTAEHPSGTGTRAASGAWGIASTGGGFVDGRIVFSSAFELPMTSGASVPFTAADLAEVRMNHVESAFEGGGAIAPIFSFTASGDQILSASGTVAHEGSQIRLINVLIQTNIERTLFRNPGGVLVGQMKIDGIAPGMEVLTADGIAQPDGTSAVMIINSQFPGNWLLTEIPEPASAALALGGLALLIRRRK